MVGRGLKSGNVEVRCRADGSREEIPIAQAVEFVSAKVRSDLEDASARAEKVVPASLAATGSLANSGNQEE